VRKITDVENTITVRAAIEGMAWHCLKYICKFFKGPVAVLAARIIKVLALELCSPSVLVVTILM
jgi:hypothetical protein